MGKFLDTIMSWFGIENKDKFSMNGGTLYNDITVKDYIENVEKGTELAKDKSLAEIISGEEQSPLMDKLGEKATDAANKIAQNIDYTTGSNFSNIFTNENNNETSGIVDTTGKNEDINFQEIYDRIAADQKAQWEREDAIRKETQEREDSAYQRAVEDMRKAGINPNLIGVTPAQSGGGITQATGKDYSLYQTEVQKSLTELENILNRDLKADENTKDRIAEIIRTLLTVSTMIMIKK